MENCFDPCTVLGMDKNLKEHREGKIPGLFRPIEHGFEVVARYEAIGIDFPRPDPKVSASGGHAQSLLTGPQSFSLTIFDDRNSGCLSGHRDEFPVPRSGDAWGTEVESECAQQMPLFLLVLKDGGGPTGAQSVFEREVAVVIP